MTLPRGFQFFGKVNVFLENLLTHCQKMKISGEDFGFYIIVFLITLSLFYNLFASTLILRMWRLYRNIYLWLQLCYLYPLSRCQIIVISDNMAKSFGLKISKISNWTSIIWKLEVQTSKLLTSFFSWPFTKIQKVFTI